jgi:uncharacterized protein
MPTEQTYSEEPSLKDFELTFFNIPRFIILVFIRFYQKFISPALPANTCRFYPSCSRYGFEAVKKYGAIKGTYLAVYRVLRCNPFNPGGYDPVP